MEHYSGYTALDLEPCETDVLQLWKTAPQNSLTAVREKYSTPRLFHVSQIPPPESIPRRP